MEPTFESDWFSGNIPVWENVLGHLKGKPDLSFLEIGSYEGKSACWLLTTILTHDTSRLTCIDIFYLNEESIDISARMKVPVLQGNRSEQKFDANIRAIRAEEKVTKLKGESRQWLRTLPLSTFDCIYIDGSHTSKGVLTDAVLSFDLLKTGGILIFDDYQWNCFPEAPLKNPKTGIDAFLTCFNNEYDVLHKSYQVIVRKTQQQSNRS